MVKIPVQHLINPLWLYPQKENRQTVRQYEEREGDNKKGVVEPLEKLHEGRTSSHQEQYFSLYIETLNQQWRLKKQSILNIYIKAALSPRKALRQDGNNKGFT